MPNQATFCDAVQSPNYDWMIDAARKRGLASPDSVRVALRPVLSQTRTMRRQPYRNLVTRSSFR
jgi:hypothetical protein